jgi:hypothetical protein
LKYDEPTLANMSSRRMYMPDNVVAKVEVCVFDDGSCKISNLPNDHIAGILLRLGIKMLSDDSAVDIDSIANPEIISNVIGKA